MSLPDPNVLFDELVASMRPAVGADTALIGIYTGGVWLAQRLHQALGLATAPGFLATTLYRDDFSRIGLHSERRPTVIPYSVEGRDLILVDDVLYTGRTVRAAINEIFDFGRPRSIRLACLLDRGGRELPIAPDFCPCRLPLARDQMFVLSQGADGRLALELQSTPSRS